MSTDDQSDYPRPQLVREGWKSLDGQWDFAIDEDRRWRSPRDVDWQREITVPFAVETPASGIAEKGFLPPCWYRRQVTALPAAPGERVVVHFGAVDYHSRVWVDGELAAVHEGGYTPFTVELPASAGSGTSHELVVRVEDDPTDLAKPRGKQDWTPEPHGIWYVRTTGIWQTVWMERLPTAFVTRLDWTPNLDDVEVAMSIELDEDGVRPLRVRVRLRLDDVELVDDILTVTGGRLERRFHLDRPGLDPMRDGITWSPEHPSLIDAIVEVLADDGTVIDRVTSYTALRSVAVQNGRFLLNGRPYQLRLVLDQGYWPETGMTAPDDGAFRRDLELAKAMGFNGVRMHQKIEDPRFLGWADRLGMLVWAEMPAAYRFEPRAIRRCIDQWGEAVRRDSSHPCIVAWVLFNESYGVLDVAHRDDQRHFVEAASALCRALDPTRLVVANDGWQNVAGDIIAIHDYDPVPELISSRYNAEGLDEMMAGYGRHGRVVALDDPGWLEARHGTEPSRRAVVLSEFGGIAFSPEAPTPLLEHPDDATVNRSFPGASGPWGYSASTDADDFLRRYAGLLRAAHSLAAFSGFCYTQLTDVYQEVNGLLRADRTPKLPLDTVAALTRGQFEDGG